MSFRRPAVFAAFITLTTLPVLAPTAPAAHALDTSPSTRVWDGKVDATGAAPINTNWTTGANWVGDTPPLPGSILAFPSTAVGKTATNDFPTGTSFSELRVETGGYTLDGNQVTVVDLLQSSGSGTKWNLPIKLGGLIDFVVDGGTAVYGQVDNNGHDLIVKTGSTGEISFNGGMVGTGGLVVAYRESGSPRVALSGSNNTFTGGVVVEGGTYTTWGDFTTHPGPVVLDGGDYTAAGTVAGSVTATEWGGLLYLTSNNGVTIQGNLTLNDASAFGGGGHAVVQGAVTLNDAWLDLDTYWCGHCSSSGFQRTLIDNDGSDPVAGAFYDLPEGAVFEQDGDWFWITYKAGDGNDVKVVVVEEPAPPVPPAPPRSGYWMVTASGHVYAFGDAKHYGAPAGEVTESVVDIEPAPDNNGYWVLTSHGSVRAYGSARRHQGPASWLMRADEQFTSISATPDGGGYWLFTNKGRVRAHGNAVHHGDMTGHALNGPVKGSVATPTGNGYFMVASDGGIFAFGDAVFRGSMGGKPLNGAVVGLSPDPDEFGYWLVALDGGIFAYDAGFKGSMGGKPLNKPVVGMVPYGDGYLMVASDGGIFNFNSKPFAGSLGANPPASPVVGVAPLNE